MEDIEKHNPDLADALPKNYGAVGDDILRELLIRRISMLEVQLEILEGRMVGGIARPRSVLLGNLSPQAWSIEHADPFGGILPGPSWTAWRIMLIAAMGEELTLAERAIFTHLTGRACEPGRRVEELWAIVGRRGGKTHAIAVLAAYIAALIDFSDVLAPGERASLPIMSASMWQAQKCYQYLDGIFSGVPALHKLVTGQTSDTISLSTRPTSNAGRRLSER